jgi:hypothetical protein
MRLNGWQRIGIALSVLWAIYGALSAYYAIYNPISRDYSDCILPSSGEPSVDLKICDRTRDIRLANAQSYRWQTIGLVALVPILIAWLTVYALIALGRWIRAGFRGA